MASYITEEIYQHIYICFLSKAEPNEATAPQDVHVAKKGSGKEAEGEAKTAENNANLNQSGINPADEKKQQRDELLKALKIKVDRE